jgi:S1-C subfamily serine protease
MTRLLTLAAVALTAAAWTAPAHAEDKTPGFLGLKLMGEEGDRGPKIDDVVPDGPAAKAGVKPGDILLKIGDKAVKTPPEAVEAARALKPGTKVKLQVLRDGKEKDIEVTVGKPPAQPPQ